MVDIYIKKYIKKKGEGGGRNPVFHLVLLALSLLSSEQALAIPS